MRMLTTKTHLRLEAVIQKLSTGEIVTLQERLELHKYSLRYPLIAGKVSQALEK